MSESKQPRKKRKASAEKTNDNIVEIEQNFPDCYKIGVVISEVRSRPPQPREEVSNLPFEFWDRSDIRTAVRLIFDQLSLYSIARCSQVRKQWKEITTDSSVWKALFLDYFGPLTTETTDFNWKEEFKTRYTKLHEPCTLEGSPSRSLVFRSERKRGPFIPPTITFLNPIRHSFIKEPRVLVYRNYVVLVCGWRVSLFDLTTSEPIWDHEDLHDCHDYRSVVMDRTKVFCLNVVGSLTALNLENGYFKWETKHRQLVEFTLGESEVIGLDPTGTVIGHNKENGNVLYTIDWNNSMKQAVSPVSVQDGKIFWMNFRAGQPEIVVGGVKQQQVLLKTKPPSDFPKHRKLTLKFTAHKDTLYCISFNTKADNINITALQLNYQNSSTAVSWNYAVGKKFLSCLFTKPPVYYNGKVWATVATQTKEGLVGVVIGLDAVTGKELYKLQFQISGVVMMLNIDLHHYVLDGVLYYTVMDGNYKRGFVGAVDTATGERLWKSAFTHDCSFPTTHLVASNSHIKCMLGHNKYNTLVLWHQ